MLAPRESVQAVDMRLEDAMGFILKAGAKRIEQPKEPACP
jgi:hypothetical protein